MIQIVPPVTVPVVTVPVTNDEPSVALSPFVVSHLAREIAFGQREVESILTSHNVALADYEKLKQNETFQKLVDTSRLEWDSALNTITRTQLEAAYLVEQTLPVIYARMVDGTEPLNHVVDAGKWLSDVAGLKKGTTEANPGERFHIEINLGADTKLTFDASKNPIAPQGALLDGDVKTITHFDIDPEERV